MWLNLLYLHPAPHSQAPLLGVLAPNAKLRRAVTVSAGPAGATLQLLQDSHAKSDKSCTIYPSKFPSLIQGVTT